MDEFEEAVRAAVDSVPEPFQHYLDDIVFVVAERSGRLLGLYQGAGALARGGPPARITLYRELHARASADWDELVAMVRDTVLHEIGHHFGMGEEELRRSGL